MSNVHPLKTDIPPHTRKTRIGNMRAKLQNDICAFAILRTKCTSPTPLSLSRLYEQGLVVVSLCSSVVNVFCSRSTDPLFWMMKVADDPADRGLFELLCSRRVAL